MEASKNTFHYGPLDEVRKEIRILILQPASLIQDDIHCDVFHAQISESSNYEAVSYAWGDPSVTIPIFLRGQSFQATMKLGSALRHLRYPSSPRALWINAICVDQLHDDERGLQVAIMGGDLPHSICLSSLAWTIPDSESTDSGNPT
jgi:hypothetical protein